VRRFRDHYGLKNGDRVLDVAAPRAFTLHDFKELLPGLNVTGLDISQYAIDNALESVKPHLQVGNARQLPYPDAPSTW